MIKRSAEFQVAGFAWTKSEAAKTVNLPKNGPKTEIHNHMQIFKSRIQSIKFLINPMKNVGVAGTRSEGRTDGKTDAHTDGRGSFL